MSMTGLFVVKTIIVSINNQMICITGSHIMIFLHYLLCLFGVG